MPSNGTTGALVATVIFPLWFDAEGVVFRICSGGEYELVGAAVEMDAEMGFVGERSVVGLVGSGGGVAGGKGVEVFMV